MNFRVLWTPVAEQQLADLWISASDRGAITAAANEVDRLLAANPLAQGESRFDQLRVTFEAPLGVEYEVHEADRLVYVLAVWSFGRERPAE